LAPKHEEEGLDMKDRQSTDVLRSSDGVTSAVSYTVNDAGHISICLQMSSAWAERLFDLARVTGTTLDDVIAKAFILYDAAVNASREGKAIGIAATPDVLETEFVGFEAEHAASQ
jgi:hypothetical protein